MPKKILLLSAALLVSAAALSACTFPWKKAASPAGNTQTEEEAATTPSETAASTGTGKLKKFNDYNELAEFLAANDNPTAVAVRASAGLAKSGAMAVPAVSAESVSQTDSSQPNNSLDYSATNNQVAGVDEPDIIKTDGRYIYALVRNELSIINVSTPAESKVVSKITFKSRPQDIFINGNFLAVFGNDSSIYSQEAYKSFRRQNAYLFFKVFDISDPANPKQVRDLDFEGSYRDARLIGDIDRDGRDRPGRNRQDQHTGDAVAALWPGAFG